MEPAHGLSVDDAMTRVNSALDAPTLRLYTYRPCALIGRFQRLDDEVNVDYCSQIGLPINRRPTGGGSIIMGPDQLGVAFIVPAKWHRDKGSAAELMRRTAEGIVIGLRSFGIEAIYSGKNDLTVAGRKLAGLGLYIAETGTRLFHASILVDLDVDYMLRVLKTPFSKLADKGFRNVTDSISTVRRECDTDVSMDAVKDAIIEGYRQHLGLKVVNGDLSEEEKCIAQELKASKYANDDWIYQSASAVRDRVGYCQSSTDRGSLHVRAIVAGRTIKSIYINGDFIATHNAVQDLETRLRWHESGANAIESTIRDSMSGHAGAWNGMPMSSMTQAVLSAVENSWQLATDSTPHPCFARDGQQHG